MLGFKRRRRERIRRRPFPPEWLPILQRNVPYYRLLTPEEQNQLQGHVLVFLDEKRFEGCGGLELTDEIRVTIAAQACILLLGRQTDYYPRMKSIFVYPHGYFAQAVRPRPDGVLVGGAQSRAGESWYRGPVVLSWDDVRKGAGDAHDGHNVVLHEFAHQLDSEDGQVDGAPALPRRSMYLAGRPASPAAAGRSGRARRARQVRKGRANELGEPSHQGAGVRPDRSHVRGAGRMAVHRAVDGGVLGRAAGPCLAVHPG